MSIGLRRSILVVKAIIPSILWAAWCLSGCQDEPFEQPDDSTPVVNMPLAKRVETFCGHCHAFPAPQSFAKREWAAEVAQGFRFYEGAENLHLDPPPETEVVAYYEALAPESLPLPTSASVSQDNLLQLAASASEISANSVSHITQDPVSGRLWACDMRSGKLFSTAPDGKFQEKSRPIELLNPCRLTTIDWDRDGRSEFLISDLGAFFPQDHQDGSAWFYDPDEPAQFKSIIEGTARVSDVQPGDLDGDGDFDLVMAEFGWRRSGKVNLLWNDGTNAAPVWRVEVLDQRHGAIDVPIVDLNQDGQLDIVVLLSQEFEMVLAYLNQGEGRFEQHPIYAAGDPSFGSSGIQLVDFDNDHDLDVIHSNGDSFDSSHVKPFHGIRWLENRGAFPFETHAIATMAGVHRAVAGDIDRDGDLDVAAVSLLPPIVLKEHSGIPSALWLERTTEGKYVPHVCEVDQAQHACCLLQDADHDGDLDLVATNFRWQEESGPPVTWWTNTKLKAAQASK